LAVETLETEQANINEELVKPETYTNAELIKTLQARLEKIEAEIETKLMRWEELEKKM